MAKYQITVARATSEEIQHLNNLLSEIQWLSDHFRIGGDVETIDWEDYEILGRHKATDASELLKNISKTIAASRFEKILFNLQTLLDNVADPDIPHLDFNSEIKRALEALQTKQTIDQQNIGNMKELLSQSEINNQRSILEIKLSDLNTESAKIREEIYALNRKEKNIDDPHAVIPKQYRSISEWLEGHPFPNAVNAMRCKNYRDAFELFISCNTYQEFYHIIKISE